MLVMLAAISIGMFKDSASAIAPGLMASANLSSSACVDGMLVRMGHLLLGDCFDVWNWKQVAPVVHEKAVANCVGPEPARLADDEPEGSGCFS
jgi:hypothetical protein